MPVDVRVRLDLSPGQLNAEWKRSHLACNSFCIGASACLHAVGYSFGSPRSPPITRCDTASWSVWYFGTAPPGPTDRYDSE